MKADALALEVLVLNREVAREKSRRGHHDIVKVAREIRRLTQGGVAQKEIKV